MEGFNKRIGLDDINPNLLGNFAYGIRIFSDRAFEIEDELKKGIKKPFDKVIHATLGCCHSGGQQPITFIRKLLAGIVCPSNNLELKDLPEDIKEKTNKFLKSVPGGSIGSYSQTNGIPLIRQLAAKYIEERDEINNVDWKNIYLTNGASGGVFNLLTLLQDTTKEKKVGVLTPIPEYPLYSTILDALGMTNVGYYLDEDNQWGVNIKELQLKLNEAKSKCYVKAIVVINPGNPTSQVLSKSNIEEIIKFANEHNLMIIADEVYQMNIHNDNLKFYSFHKIIRNLNLSPNNITLASLMSASKGFLGECGLRGGYVHIYNMDKEVQKVFEKLLILGLCPTTFGQAALYSLFSTPKENDPSYELFLKEKTQIQMELKIKAKMTEDAFNGMEGFSCTRIDGALYAFPKITFPEKVLKAAQSRNENPDNMYCRELLESVGVSAVSGSSFGQKPGTYHIRITLLQPVCVMRELFEKIYNFHQNFLNKYK
ncbi:alanine aminotransferase 2-like [Onthophagus taurus]|uniref:alanine aminotransferase 2-like n=1 Tax=Onthophagus taurus TaxID=166361 RepID=UPI0039BECDB5